jgi:hypothetical protein
MHARGCLRNAFRGSGDPVSATFAEREHRRAHGLASTEDVGSDLDDLEDRLRHVVADMRTTLEEIGELRRAVAAKGKR